MDQIKIGKFIKEKRKEKNITQTQLAEKLNITDRAISKWENGNCMPDSSIITELCDILDISINDLYSGEMVDMKDYEKTLEKNLLEIIKQKEECDKHLLNMEIVCGVIGLIPLLMAVIIVQIINLEEWIEVLIAISSIIPILVATPFMIKIEQKVGYYECSICHHKYIPTYKDVFMAMHINRTRYMKCPNCSKKSWNKKRIK